MKTLLLAAAVLLQAGQYQRPVDTSKEVAYVPDAHSTFTVGTATASRGQRAYGVLKVAAGSNVTLGPMLLGVAKPVHILTPSATVRRIVNMTALTVVDCATARQGDLI